ncbi:interferon gamma receptor 1-like [Lampris incognitus]|uniref:interferon gamma receptor 1-like n=1 Tax=Lampris incognitus TaxID=2546036 RepID=UPI0024B4FC34|nr:interferon gamma receptor 1-like [Lampris incognitus]
MDVTRRLGIPLLWMLTAQIAAAQVPPATNMTLQCHNFQNIVYWNYSQPSLHPKFKISISALSGRHKPLWVESPTMHADISFLNDPDNDYKLNITAVVGQNESETSPSLIFSYFMDSLSELKCSVDLPPINVTIQPDDIIRFSFFHPLHFYRQTLTEMGIKPKKEWKVFDYKALAKDQRKENTPHEFSCEEIECVELLAVESGQKSYCVTVAGQWEKLAVNTKQEYCTSVLIPSKVNYVVLGVILAILICVIAGSLVMIVIKKTSSSSPTPSSMLFSGRQNANLQDVEKTEVSPLEASSPGISPLLPLEEDDEGDDLSIEDGSMSADPKDRLKVPEYMLDQDFDKDPEELPSGTPEMDNNTSNGYERRPVTVDKLSPSETVKGYRVGRTVPGGASSNQSL